MWSKLSYLSCHCNYGAFSALHWAKYALAFGIIDCTNRVYICAEQGLGYFTGHDVREFPGGDVLPSSHYLQTVCMQDTNHDIRKHEPWMRG